MKLFDKKYVYFMWDDCLKDKQVLVEDDIYNLEKEVNDGDTGFLEVEKSDTNEPFRIANDCVVYKFAYYDPNYLCKIAYYKQGETIQIKDCQGWLDWKLNADPEWDLYEFRIKPEESKYRPFKDTKELIDHWQLNYNPGAASRPQYSKPIIWLSYTDDSEVVLMVTGYTNNSIQVNGNWKSMSGMFKDFCFTDGKPLGVKE